ncbi:MAG: type II secretion system F family protein [Verrucomicrobia bacterium]|nr:type II secretion system F family protein [Verrucomicrobiota bacterium]MCH8527619.1 type II secretion system F family protein [Kiritimatiellia bacterium]
MPWYTYHALDSNGEPQHGTIEAETLSAARWALREDKLRTRELRECDPPPSWLRLPDPRALMPVKSVQVEVSLRQLAMMLRSGLPLLASLETLIEQAPGPGMRRVWARVRDRVEQGGSLADALETQRPFGHATVQLARLGEESGNLDLVLRRAADSMEKRRILKQTTINALLYPIITLVSAIGIASYMVLGVIPQMERFLNALGRRLPPITQSLLDFSNLIQRHAGNLLVTLVMSVVVFTGVFLWPPGRLRIDRALLRIPLIGGILRTAATALFSRSMSILLQSGIPLLEGLRAVQRLHNNRWIAARLDHARREVMDGHPLSEPLAAPFTYTPMLPRMVAVGEAGGTLDEVLEEVADFHEESLAHLIKQLSALIEPAIIFFVGGIVGYVYIAFFVGLFAATGGR